MSGIQYAPLNLTVSMHHECILLYLMFAKLSPHKTFDLLPNCNVLYTSIRCTKLHSFIKTLNILENFIRLIHNTVAAAELLFIAYLLPENPILLICWSMRDILFN